MYGSFPTSLQQAMRPFITGQRVIDFGSGDGERARILKGMQPEALLCIEKAPITPPEFEPVRKYFIDAAVNVRQFRPTVGHVAWPTNVRLAGLVECLRKIPTVVYVGCNTDGSACGDEELFGHFMKRPVKLHLPTRRNTLIVYGPFDPELTRRPCGIEEEAALDTSTIYPYPYNYPAETHHDDG